MSQADNGFDVEFKDDEDFDKMFKSARSYSIDRDKKQGVLDSIVIEYLDKLKEMKLEPLIEKEIRHLIDFILRFVEGPYHSEILPGEVDWLLLKFRMPPPPKSKARSPEEILRDITTYQTFRDINALSTDFVRILSDSISKLPTDIYEWARDNVRFISSREDSLAFSLRIGASGIPINIKECIFLCESLKYVTKEVQTKTIAHEIAHIKQGYLKPPLRKLSVKEVKKREEEADKLAEEWLTRAQAEAVNDRIERDDTRGSKYEQ